MSMGATSESFSPAFAQRARPRTPETWLDRVNRTKRKLDYILFPARLENRAEEARVEWRKVKSAVESGDTSAAVRIADGIYFRFVREIADLEFEEACQFRDEKAVKPAYAKAILEVDYFLEEAKLARSREDHHQVVYYSRQAMGRLYEAVAEQRQIWEVHEAIRLEREAAVAEKSRLAKDKAARQLRNRLEKAEKNRRFAASCPSGRQGPQPFQRYAKTKEGGSGKKNGKRKK